MSDAAQRPKVFLHIGHGKTGTTATQNLLTLKAPELRARGICYPEVRARSEAEEGRITSGNLGFRDSAEPWVRDRILRAMADAPGCPAYVFSNEVVFWSILPQLPALAELSARCDLTVVLVLREPVDMLKSVYSQMIKRGGFTGALEDLLERESHLNHALRVVEACEALGIGIGLLNYSVLGHAIAPRLFALFGAEGLLDAATDPPALRTANRSLTLEERRIVKALNRTFGAEMGARCSDALVERLPRIAAEPPEISPELEARIVEKNREAAEALNRRLPAGDAIRLAASGGVSEAAAARLSAAQLDVILGTLHFEMEKLRRGPQSTRRRSLAGLESGPQVGSDAGSRKPRRWRLFGGR